MKQTMFRWSVKGSPFKQASSSQRVQWSAKQQGTGVHLNRTTKQDSWLRNPLRTDSIILGRGRSQSPADPRGRRRDRPDNPTRIDSCPSVLKPAPLPRNPLAAVLPVQLSDATKPPENCGKVMAEFHQGTKVKHPVILKRRQIRVWDWDVPLVEETPEAPADSGGRWSAGVRPQLRLLKHPTGHVFLEGVRSCFVLFENFICFRDSVVGSGIRGNGTQ